MIKKCHQTSDRKKSLKTYFYKIKFDFQKVDLPYISIFFKHYFDSFKSRIYHFGKKCSLTVSSFAI